MVVRRVQCLTLALAFVLASSIGVSAEEIASEDEGKHLNRPRNTSATNKSRGACEYSGQWYDRGAIVPTKEPCLVCTCNSTLVCHLRVCLAVSTTVPRGCYKLKKAGRCCAEVVCDGELNGNRLYRKDGEQSAVTEVVPTVVQRQQGAAAAAAAAEAAVLGTRRRGGASTTELDTSSIMGCVSDGAVFAEGSAMMSHDECSYCFCIHGRRQCVAPKCILPLEGCRPRYRTFSCCPNFYDCHDASSTTLLPPTTTTISSPVTKACEVDGVEYEDGSRVDEAEGNKCESCFCLRGRISCSNHTCDVPADTEGCTPVLVEGSCCPISYDCGDESEPVILDQRQSRQFGNKGVAPTNTENDEPISSDPLPGPEEADTQDEFVTEDTPSEDTTEENPSNPSTSKPPPRLRPMSRPSFAELVKRRQQSRFTSRRTEQPMRIQRPARLGQTSSGSLSLSERLKKRNKYTRTTPEDPTNPLSYSSPSQFPSTYTTGTPEEKQSKATTTTFIPKATTTTFIHKATTTNFNPNTATTKPYTIAINQLASTTTDIFTSNPTNILPLIPTTNKPRLTTPKPRTTTKSNATNPERPTTIRKVPKETTFRWSKFRYSAREAPTTSRAPFSFPTRAPPLPPAPTAEKVVTKLRPLQDSRHEVTGVGHVGEVFLIQDGKRLTPFAPFSTSTPVWQKPVEVGTGVNVKGNLDDATAFGPILIYDNRVRTERQQKTKNATELSTEKEEERVTAATDAPAEETTILPQEAATIEVEEAANVAAPSSDPQESDKENEDAKLTTMLSPAEPQETTILPQANSPQITLSTPTTPAEPQESSLPTTEDIPDTSAAEKPVDIEYLDLDTYLPTYDITVGSSVMTTGHGHHSPVGVGQVIPIKLEPEDLIPHSRPASRPDSKITTLKILRQKETEPEEPGTVTEAVEGQDQKIIETETTPAQTIKPEVKDMLEPEHREEGEEELKMEHKGTTEGEVLEAEHKTPEIESVSEATRPSILSALFNILTQTERPILRPRPDPTRGRPRPEWLRPDRPKSDRPRPDHLRPDRPRTERPRPDRYRPEWQGPPRPRPERPFATRPKPERPETFRPRPEQPSTLKPRPDQPDTPRPRTERPDTPGLRPNRVRTERPRPERLPPPVRQPFRPRPRPNGRPEFIPPRFRFTTPAPTPDTATEEETTTQSLPPTHASPPEEPQEVSSPIPGLSHQFTPPKPESPGLTPQFTPPKPESPGLSPQFTPPKPENPGLTPQFTPPKPESPGLPPQFTPPKPESSASAPFIPPFLQPTPPEPRPSVPNTNPIPLFNLPDPIHIHPTLRPFIPPPAPPSAQLSPVDIGGLPSKPVLESGFQGMRKEGEGVQPNFDFPEDYDHEGEPTLPPSLPNLKIIPFVAADALTGADRPFSSEDPRSTPRPLFLPVLPPIEEHEADTAGHAQPEVSTDPPSTTTTTTTTTTSTLQTTPRRTLTRRPILPPRRTSSRPANGDAPSRRPFVPFGRPGERPSRPHFKPQSTTTTEAPTTSEIKLTISSRPELVFVIPDRPSTRPPFIPPRRTTSETTTPTPTTIPTDTPRPLHIPSFRPKPTTILPVQTSRPIDSNDISNLLLQDVFQLPPGQGSPPIRFTVGQGTPKPSRPVKPTLPEIPAAVRDQLPLATDPILASGLLKLSGCNIYGRMYVVKDRIPELSAKCKECRCTPVGVQCLPIC